MGGGIIQLVAYGIQDVFLTKDPQVTFFKNVYRRHTNFSIEHIPQQFSHKPNFGKRATAVLSRTAGDLIHHVYLTIVLPKIPQFFDSDGNVDQISKFAWAKKIGYAMIKRVEVEIGGQVIDRHYGDWLNIWSELAGPRNKIKLDEMVGNIVELSSLTNGKPSHTLYIPLQFWFCRASGLALPVIAMQYSEIKINVEFRDKDEICILAPTHFITINDDYAHFEPFEYITQTVDGQTANGIFIKHDLLTKKLYYTRIGSESFKNITLASRLVDFNVAELEELANPENQKFLIKGLVSGTEVMPKVNGRERRKKVRIPKALAIQDCFLLVEYIFLDEEERIRFLQANHEYLIDQLQFESEKTLNSQNQVVKLALNHPAKEIVWVTQLAVTLEPSVNDRFNYTDSFIHSPVPWGDTVGENLIINGTVELNGHGRFKKRQGNYFNWVQPNQHHAYSPSEGINNYSFCLFPEKHQPSGSINFSKVDDVRLRIKLSHIIDFTNPAKIRVYVRSMNILRVLNGLGGLVFSD